MDLVVQSERCRAGVDHGTAGNVNPPVSDLRRTVKEGALVADRERRRAGDGSGEGEVAVSNKCVQASSAEVLGETARTKRYAAVVDDVAGIVAEVARDVELKRCPGVDGQPAGVRDRAGSDNIRARGNV